jgi:hypothetical protein
MDKMDIEYKPGNYALLNTADITTIDKWLQALVEVKNGYIEAQGKFNYQNHPAEWESYQNDIDRAEELLEGLRKARASVLERDMTILYTFGDDVESDRQVRFIIKGLQSKFPGVVFSFAKNPKKQFRWAIYVSKNIHTVTSKSIVNYLIQNS